MSGLLTFIGYIFVITVIILLVYVALFVISLQSSRKSTEFHDRAAPDQSFEGLDAHSICLSRKSTRIYDAQKQELDTHIKEQITAYLNDEKKMTGPFGSKIRILFVPTDFKSVRSVKNTKYFLVGLGTDKTNQLDFGYVFQRVILFCTKLGLSTCWLGGGPHRPQFNPLCDLQQNEKIQIISPVGYPDTSVSKSNVGRRSFQNIVFKGLAEILSGKGEMKENEKSNQKKGNGFQNKEECGDLGNALEAAQWAPSAINDQPWRIFIVENAVDPKKHIVHFFYKSFGAIYAENDIAIAISNFTYVLEAAGISGKLEIRNNQGVQQKTITDEIQLKDDGLFPVLKEGDEGLKYAVTWVEL